MSPGSDRRARHDSPARASRARLRAGLGVAAVAAVLAASSVARAQPSEQAAAATAQFDLGRALMKQKNYAEACAAFERSQKLDPQWGTLYNLATCYAMSDRLASAWAAYRELAQRDTNPARRKESSRQARELEKRLPRLQLTVADAPPGLVVTLDGADVTALVGSENPVDLGRHVIHATAPGYADFDRAKTIVDEGKRVKLAIELRRADRARPEPAAEPGPAPGADEAGRGAEPAAEPTAHREPAVEPATEPPAAPSSRPADRPSSSRRRTYGILAAAGGGVLLVTGLVFGQLASSKWSDAKALCGDDLTCDNARDLAAGNQLVGDARSRATVSTVLVIGGVAAVGAGALLFVSARRGDPPASALRLTPAAAPGAVSLTLDGRF